jgi:hypothetical protein
MVDKGLRGAVSRWSCGTPPVWTNLHFTMGSKPVFRKLIAFAVMMALVLSMAGCKGIDIG